MATKKVGEVQKTFILLLIDLLVIFGVGSLPPVGAITPVGMKVLGIFLGCIICWLFGHLGWSSILGLMVLAIWVPGFTLNGVLASAFGNTTLLMVVFCLVFCYGLTKIGLLSWLASFMLSKKWVSKSPWTLAVAFWITIIICAAFTNQLASTVLMFSIFYEVSKKIGIQPKSSYCAAVLILLGTYGALSVALMPYASGLWIPVGMAQAVVPDLTPNVFKVVIANWLMVIAALIIGAFIFKILLAKNIVKVDFSMDNLDSIIDAKDLEMTKQIKLGFLYIGALLVVMLVPVFLPETSIGIFFNKFGVTGAFMLICLLMSLTPADDDKFAFSFEEGFKEGIPWGLYFMMVAAYYMSSIVASADSGIMATVVPVIENIVPTNNEFLTVAVFLVVILIMTNCITNFVAMQLTIPIFATILMGLGVNPMIYIGLVAVLVEHGNIMPSGSPVGAFMHGNGKWITSKQVYLWATVGSICAIIGAVFVGIPVLQLLH